MSVNWGGESFALSTHVSTNDIGLQELTAHTARYGIMNITHGGLRLLKRTLWKKGEERTVRVDWSPSQIVIWDNGEKMAASDFAPEMDLSSFNGPLYIGSDAAKNLSHVILRDVEIRGAERGVELNPLAHAVTHGVNLSHGLIGTNSIPSNQTFPVSSMTLR